MTTAALATAYQDVTGRLAPALTLTTPLTDLELTSVELMELLSVVEELLAVRLNPSQLVTVRTVGDLDRAVGAVRPAQPLTA